MARPTTKIVSETSVYHSKILDWPEDERPREKLMARGPGALSDAELLAILIRTGAGRITAVDLGKTLLQRYASLDRLAARTLQDFKQFKGLGVAKSITLMAAFELGRRAAATNRSERCQITSPEDVARRYGPLLRDLKQEVFMVLLLDSANHLIGDETITRGTLNSSLVHPREVFRRAIAEPAASVILLHNHPSGNCEPSSEDIQITRQIVEASKIIGIPVHDHVILAGALYTSFAERGIL